MATTKISSLENIPDEVISGISKIKWQWIIFVSKSNDIPKITDKLLKRGLVTITSRIKDADSNTGSVYALKISKPLICKLVVELNLVKEICNDNVENFQKVLIANEAMKVIKRTKDIEFESAWLAHDRVEFDKIFLAADTKTRLKAVYDYLGPHMALYFGWLENYTKALYLPTIIGVIVFIHQFLNGNEVDSTSLPYFAVIIAIWGTCFLEFWKRESNEMTYRWGLFGLEDEERQLELAKSAEKERPDQTLRMGVSLSVTALLIFMIARVILYFVRMNIHAEDIFGKGSLLVHFPGLVYSVLPRITPLIFKPISIMLNNYEAHTTKVSRFQIIFSKYVIKILFEIDRCS